MSERKDPCSCTKWIALHDNNSSMLHICVFDWMCKTGGHTLTLGTPGYVTNLYYEPTEIGGLAAHKDYVGIVNLMGADNAD